MNQKQDPYILWLPSWYPNKLEPFNGDFIQRHAKAAALFDPITVIFFTQYGENVKSRFKVEITKGQNLIEILVYVPFIPFNIKYIDRIRYNLKFYFFAKKFLRDYFKKSGLPYLVHVHVPIKSGNLALWIKKKFKIPFIVSEQASTYLKQVPDSYYKKHLIYKIQVKKIFAEAHWITNVSNSVGNILKQLFHIRQLTVIHNVVDTDVFNYVAYPKSRFTYIHVSTLTEQKNIFGILRSFKKLSELSKDWKLIIVGPYPQNVLIFIKENNLGGFIELMGEVSYRTVAQCMQKAHVFVLFSKHENFPCVVVEAICCGLPVISSDVAGISEAINESNGILVQSDNENQLVESLLKIRKSYSLYNPLDISKNAMEKYSYHTIGAQFHSLYTERKK